MSVTASSSGNACAAPTLVVCVALGLVGLSLGSRRLDRCGLRPDASRLLLRLMGVVLGWRATLGCLCLIGHGRNVLPKGPYGCLAAGPFKRHMEAVGLPLLLLLAAVFIWSKGAIFITMSQVRPQSSNSVFSPVVLWMA